MKQYKIQNRSPKIPQACVPLSREVEKHGVTRSKETNAKSSLHNLLRTYPA
jgi:hypothetical protein